MPFSPRGSWLWTRWHGTVLETTWKPTILLMSVAAFVVFFTYSHATWTWPLLAVPDPTNPVVMRLKALDTMWNYLLTLATFVSSFFVSQAYPFWTRAMTSVRTIQGRINDLNMLVTGYAAREASAPQHYTVEARAMLDGFARHTRLAHILFWASVVRKARGDLYTGSLSLLATETGLQGLESRGALAADERVKLLRLPAAARPNLVFTWLISRFEAGRRSGTITGGAGVEDVFLEKACALRATCASVVDDLAAPMPLAYVHFVQIVTDSVLVLAPFALFPRLGSLSIALSGILGLFYRGLLELSKSFLDPYGNDGSIGQNLQIDCLLGEVNAKSFNWAEGAEELPDDILAK